MSIIILKCKKYKALREIYGKGIRMNLEKQLIEFYSVLDYKPVSSNAISLYLVILTIDMKSNWKSDVKIANSILISKTRLSLSAIQRARNELITNEYITYKKRNKPKWYFEIFYKKII